MTLLVSRRERWRLSSSIGMNFCIVVKDYLSKSYIRNKSKSTCVILGCILMLQTVKSLIMVNFQVLENSNEDVWDLDVGYGWDVRGYEDW